MFEAPADSTCKRQNASLLAADDTTVAPTVSAQAANAYPGCVDSTELLRGKKSVEIKHNGSTYRLQATRLGKLILTK